MRRVQAVTIDGEVWFSWSAKLLEEAEAGREDSEITRPIECEDRRAL